MANIMKCSIVLLLLMCFAANVCSGGEKAAKAKAAALADVKDVAENKTWTIEYEAMSRHNMTMGDTQTLRITINGIESEWGADYELHVLAVHPELLRVERVIKSKEIGQNVTTWTGNFSMEALFLGETSVYVELRRLNHDPERANETFNVIITRSEGIMDDLYKISVGVLVFILYINFGAVLDLYALKRIILRPIGPAIGFVGMFIFIPLLSFLLGYYVFPDRLELRIGLLFTASTPAGGFSNMFTIVLNGNINLSVTMSAFSNLAAFGMMPFWIFTLGNVILEDATFLIPYEKIAMLSVSLLVPLSIGIALQKYAPRVTKKIDRYLQPVSFAMIVFVMGFAFTINSYMFTMLSWKIIIACSLLPWIGYIFGYIMGVVFRQTPADAITIAIETGIQNTGIAIFMLSFTLPQPQADITSAIPVTNFLLTPVPLIIMYVMRKMCCRSPVEELPQEDPIKETAEYEIAMLEKNEKNDKLKAVES